MDNVNKLLEVDNLNINYGKLSVVFDLSLNVIRGEVVFLVGRNGAGKTTLFRTISGFIKPSTGTVKLNGSIINNLGAYSIARKGIKYIHQDKKVFSDLSVRENLELSSYATKDYDWEPPLAMFPKLKILMDRKAGKLSGGEKQMLLIAMAIIGKPQLVMMDEPTEGLAPHIITDLTSIFKELSKTTTLLVVEQNLPMIAEIADRVYCMKEGHMVSVIEEDEKIKCMDFEKYL